MNKTGWLVNDHLTCIEGTKTFWHDLLDNIENLIPMFFSPFSITADRIESYRNPPDFIIRNASWFRRICFDKPVHTISLMQDIVPEAYEGMQLDVCENSDMIVFNSWFLQDAFKESIYNKRQTVIPIGTDFDHFIPKEVKKMFDVIFVGAENSHPKGFDLMESLISRNPELRFCLVMKDNYSSSKSNVVTYNKIDHLSLRNLFWKSKVLACTSTMETLHLSGIEAGACNIPIVATDVGVYNRIKDEDGWGYVATRDDFEEKLIHAIKTHDDFNTRQKFLDLKLDKKSCMDRWKELLTCF